MRDRPHPLFGPADALAGEAAGILVRMQGETLDVARKEGRDVVTAADLASERHILAGIRRLTPDAAILSEEAGMTTAESSRSWIVDPLDGTVNYAAGLPWFSVTMAYFEEGRPVFGLTHAPAASIVARYGDHGEATVNGRPARVSGTRDLADAVVSVVLTSHFTDEEVARTAQAIRRLGERVRGVRIIVSGALEMSLVACGRLDAFVSLKADAVSHAAAMPLVRAAGGRVTTLEGRESGDDDLVKVASHGHLHDALLALLREA